MKWNWVEAAVEVCTNMCSSAVSVPHVEVVGGEEEDELDDFQTNGHRGDGCPGLKKTEAASILPPLRPRRPLVGHSMELLLSGSHIGKEMPDPQRTKSAEDERDFVWNHYSLCHAVPVPTDFQKSPLFHGPGAAGRFDLPGCTPVVGHLSLQLVTIPQGQATPAAATAAGSVLVERPGLSSPAGSVLVGRPGLSSSPASSVGFSQSSKRFIP